jgi:threonyl-tRNA synthetase
MAEVYEFRDTASHHHHGNVNSLSRVTGIAAKSRPDFIALKTSIQEAEKRNHRKLGRQLKLFYFAEESPGSPFFLPHGTRILRSLINFLKKKNKEFGFEEVISPIIFEKELWKRSGHWDNYKENMFMIQSRNDENTTFGVKPMNCPGHCLIYNSESRSYRDLPMRMAEFSPIHRNEATGALTGLTRVRKFHQDDGHIFCSMKDISKEIGSTLELIDKVYATLGFADYEIVLSTRPETDYMGELSEWEAAEKALTDSLENNGKKWSLNLGDGAFYGPKIDFHISDALGRKHQTATIQLDFQLPARFNLKFQDADDSIQKPVLIHRAILGSVERMLAIILEHYSGRLPFWLSPRQVVVIPVSEKFGSYATRVLDKLKQTDFYVDIDLSDKAFGKKIREAQLLQYNFILIVGEREQDSGTVSVRTRERGQISEQSVSEFVVKCEQLERERI